MKHAAVKMGSVKRMDDSKAGKCEEYGRKQGNVKRIVKAVLS